MPAYELYARRLVSAIELPELEPWPPARAALTEMTFESRLPSPPADGWFEIWPAANGEPWVRAARTDTGYHVQHRGRAEFLVDPARGRLSGAPVDCEPSLFRHFLIDNVVPLMLSVDHLVLHASTVRLGDRTVAFAGPSGSGKSTLALALARRGHGIGSDDTACLSVERDGVIARPSHPGIRVWPDTRDTLASGLAGERSHALAKERLRSGLTFFREAAIQQIYVLSTTPSPHVAIERLAAREATMDLVANAYRLALDDPRALASQLETAASIATRVPAWRLSHPRDLQTWYELAEAVEHHARGGLAQAVGS